MTQFREITDRYQLVKILKSGARSTILQAVDTRSGRTVVIKSIPVGGSEGLAAAPRFAELARALASLRHAALPAALDAGITPDGSAFLVMAPLEGRPLETLEGLPENRVAAIVGQALSGLEALASRGLAHHNLTPDNLFLARSERGERIVLTGLGTALFRPPAEADPRWLAPEVVAGGPAGIGADLWSLARLAHPALGERLAGVFERALLPDPADRPSLEELREELLRALGRKPAVPEPAPEPVPAPPPTAEPPPAPEPPSLLFEPPPAPLAPAGPAAEVPGDGSGGLLSDVEGMLDSLETPPPPAGPGAGRVVRFPERQPAPAPPASAPAAPLPASAGSGPARKARGSRTPLLLAGAGLFLLLAAGGVLWWWLRSERAADAPVAPGAAAVPVATPAARPPAERIEEAGRRLAEGDDYRALRLLRSVSPADQASLPAGGCARFAALEEVLALSLPERLPADLERGLASGDVGLLLDVVDASAGGALAAAPELDRARSAVGLYARAHQAQVEQRPTEALARFASLAEMLPGATDPLSVREQTAAAFEAEAESLGREGRYEEALARLEPVLRTWPDREGLAGRVDGLREARRQEREQLDLIRKLESYERGRRPHEALELIETVTPTAHLAPRFADFRRRFEEQLARLDAQPPKIVLREGYRLTYLRGNVIELSFRATDDYEVRSVKLMARPEGGRMQELPLERSSFGYRVQMPAAFHRNGTVEVYVEATDRSGHRGTLGTPEQPIRVEREQAGRPILR